MEPLRRLPPSDGVVTVPESLAVGSFVDVEVVDVLGPDLVAEPVAIGAGEARR